MSSRGLAWQLAVKGILGVAFSPVTNCRCGCVWEPMGEGDGNPHMVAAACSILEELSMRLDTKFPAQFRVPQTNPPSHKKDQLRAML